MIYDKWLRGATKVPCGAPATVLGQPGQPRREGGHHQHHRYIQLPGTQDRDKSKRKIKEQDVQYDSLP